MEPYELYNAAKMKMANDAEFSSTIILIIYAL